MYNIFIYIYIYINVLYIYIYIYIYRYIYIHMHPSLTWFYRDEYVPSESSFEQSRLVRCERHISRDICSIIQQDFAYPLSTYGSCSPSDHMLLGGGASLTFVSQMYLHCKVLMSFFMFGHVDFTF